MKKILFLIVTVVAALGAYAQSTNNGQVTTKIITGVVVDKENVPVAGATVGAVNGAEVVETDQNGAYSIEVPVWLKEIYVSYPGMSTKEASVKKKSEVNFKMNKKLSKLNKKK